MDETYDPVAGRGETLIALAAQVDVTREPAAKVVLLQYMVKIYNSITVKMPESKPEVKAEEGNVITVDFKKDDK